ncbi:unnamed protein product [Peniophora sp. CBMAI 1063]|nr:unnamed protein product [Peniophora sp. CBMAI 1063]
MESAVHDIKKRHQDSRSIKFDKPMAAGLLDKGFLALQHGDAVFARPAGGKVNGSDDVLQVVVLGNNQIVSVHRDALLAARDEILGPLSERGPSVPVASVGGTAFERSGYADPIEHGARAYSILTSEQKARGRIVGPGVAYKVRPEHRDWPGPTMRANALKAAVTAGIAAARYLPIAYQNALRLQADLVNAPRFGCDHNYLFSSAQINLARPVPYDHDSQSLRDLGSFGIPHIDQGDMPEGFTAFQVCSDLPASIDPGQFVIFELGVFINLDGIVIVLFRGVQYHGGCAPRPRSRNVVIPDGAYRVAFVTYGKAAVYLGLGTYVLGSLRTVRQSTTLPRRAKVRSHRIDDADASSEAESAAVVDDDVSGSGSIGDVSRRYLTIGPDILNNPESRAQESWIAHPNFARDASDIMSATALVTFFVKIDSAKFFSAFSYQDASGTRQVLTDWANAPHVNDVDANEPRRSAASEWKKFSSNVTRVIPFSVIQQDTRNKLIAKGKPVPRVFAVHDAVEADAGDGAERPQTAYFAPVKKFKAAEQKTIGGRRSKAGVNASAAGTSRSAGRRSKPGVDTSSNSGSDHEELEADGLPSGFRRSQRLMSKQSPEQDEESVVETSEESSRPARKRPRLGGVRKRKRPIPEVATDEEIGTETLSPRSASKPSSSSGVVNEEYLCWLRRLLGEHPPGTVRVELLRAFQQSHQPLVTSLTYDMDDRVICSSWSNPLNGPVSAWEAADSPCGNVESLPLHARNLFSGDALDTDFVSAYYESATLLPMQVDALDHLPSYMASALLLGVPFEAQASLTAATSAWRGLDSLRAQVAKDSLLDRAAAATLMAYEALLCISLESLATSYCRRDMSTGDSQLLGVSSSLWSKISQKRDVDPATFILDGRSYTVHAPMSSRSVQSDFARQRIVYRMLFDLLAARIGVLDSCAFRLRSWFVWAIIDILGFEGLFHAPVYSAWEFPYARLLPARSTKDPTLDFLLPLVGHLSQCHDVVDKPLAALMTLSLAVCTKEERDRALDAARLAATFTRDAVGFQVRPPIVYPPQIAQVHRSLAVLSALIGLPHDDNGAVDITGIGSVTLDGQEVPLRPEDATLLGAAAQNLDKYLPFRYHAPSAKALRGLVAPPRMPSMCTDLGLKNVVAIRYISYNAPFLLSGEQQFANRVQDLVDAFERTPIRPKKYFLVDNIYGQNRSRSLDRLPSVWDRCRWPRELGRDFFSVWRAFAFGVDKAQKYKIPNVGPLLSLQICGDYFFTGHLNEPSVLQMGEIIFKIYAGGISGLEKMGFLPTLQGKRGSKAKHELGTVQDAFDKYYNWSLVTFSVSERDAWRWNTITAENHLCKHSRLYEHIKCLSTERT